LTSNAKNAASSIISKVIAVAMSDKKFTKCGS
jgi:hypothetical protein